MEWQFKHNKIIKNEWDAQTLVQDDYIQLNIPERADPMALPRQYVVSSHVILENLLTVPSWPNLTY